MCINPDSWFYKALDSTCRHQITCVLTLTVGLRGEGTATLCLRVCASLNTAEYVFIWPCSSVHMSGRGRNLLAHLVCLISFPLAADTLEDHSCHRSEIISIRHDSEKPAEHGFNGIAGKQRMAFSSSNEMKCLCRVLSKSHCAFHFVKGQMSCKWSRPGAVSNKQHGPISVYHWGQLLINRRSHFYLETTSCVPSSFA